MSRICLHCRARIDDGPCDLGGDHEVLDLEVPSERKRFEAALWRGAPPSRPISLTRWMIGGLWVAFFAAAILLDAHEPIGLLGVMLASTVLFTIALSRLLRHGITLEVQAPWAPRLPVGVDGDLPLQTIAAGTVRGAASVRSPLGKRLCVAWGLALQRSTARHGAILFTDGATGGFFIEVLDEPPIRIPAGRIRVAFIGETAAYEVGPGVQLEDARHAATGGHLSLVPATRAREVLIQPGDRVIIASPLADERIPGEGYRDGSWRRVAAGVPIVMIG